MNANVAFHPGRWKKRQARSADTGLRLKRQVDGRIALDQPCSRSSAKGAPLPATGAPADCLFAGALAVLAPWPAAGPTLAFLQLLLSPANAAFSGHRLFGILDPANELVAAQRRDVLPGIERRRVADQSFAQVFRESVDHPTGHSLVAHKKR